MNPTTRDPAEMEAIAASEADAGAANWLERQDRDDWGDADQSALDAWLAQSLAHRVAYWRLKAAWSRTERLSVLRPVRPGQSVKPNRKWLRFGKGAAALGAVLLGAAAIYLNTPTNQWTYATPLGGHETVRLGDGSQIELNTDTSIRVASDGNERKVWLDKGEAYFQIRHNAQHPFTVITPDLRIVDLGTKFVVRRNGSQLQVSLVEGRARLEPSRDSQTRKPAILAPGDVAIATAESISVARKPLHLLDAQMSWRRDVLVFDHTTLGAAAAEFNRYNSEKLVVADTSAASRTIGGTFPKNGLSDFAEVARAMLGLKVTRDGNEIIISH